MYNRDYDSDRKPVRTIKLRGVLKRNFKDDSINTVIFKDSHDREVFRADIKTSDDVLGNWGLDKILSYDIKDDTDNNTRYITLTTNSWYYELRYVVYRNDETYDDDSQSVDIAKDIYAITSDKAFAEKETNRLNERYGKDEDGNYKETYYTMERLLVNSRGKVVRSEEVLTRDDKETYNNRYDAYGEYSEDVMDRTNRNSQPMRKTRHNSNRGYFRDSYDTDSENSEGYRGHYRGKSYKKGYNRKYDYSDTVSSNSEAITKEDTDSVTTTETANTINTADITNTEKEMAEA